MTRDITDGNITCGLNFVVQVLYYSRASIAHGICKIRWSFLFFTFCYMKYHKLNL